jgi:soluble lytic murein transglycosylase-like protein
MAEYGLPPQFYYLALQESDFNVHAIGPLTRWGRAKGLWQFIPSTALQYGLDPGPMSNDPLVDWQDERHDFAKSSQAAARYLRTIFATLTQASGLLVVASYNWGEHRVASKLDAMAGPQAIPSDAFEGIPDSAEARSYWRFLGEFSDRMPEQTKDYVARIFSAAVIGEDPRRYGFAVDNPLQRHIDAIDGDRRD